MSITDELREYTRHYSVAGSKKDTMLSAIADRIDAEHEKQVTDAFTKGAVDGIDMAELGWVRKEDGKTVSTCYVDVVPRFDWELMAQELEQFAEIVRGMAEEDA